MPIDLSAATAFVKSIDLAGTPRGTLPMSAASDAGEVFDKAKAQAQIVGSALLSFEQGVDAQVREAISSSALLAQLVANKRAAAEATPLKWFAEYFDVLQNLGWTLQEANWDDYSATGTAAEVHEQVIEVITAVLGPATTALAIVTSSLKALKAMKADSPWITIFSKESQKARIGRFQVGFVEKGESSDVLVSLFAFLIEANTTITQVLFFKFKTDKASFKARSGKVSVNRAAATALGPAIRSKVQAYLFDYVGSIKDI